MHHLAAIHKTKNEFWEDVVNNARHLPVWRGEETYKMMLEDIQRISHLLKKAFKPSGTGFTKLRTIRVPYNIFCGWASTLNLNRESNSSVRFTFKSLILIPFLIFE